jgi:phosphoserine/homoserine phosphotransferase
MKKPVICCLDLEGVLVPEIWITVARRTKIDELRLTTRDEPDYDKLMRRRLKILREHKIRLRDIQRVIAGMHPLAGARQFLDRLRARRQVVILSDTYYEFAAPLMKKLGAPTLFCNWLQTDRAGYISGYCLRERNGKEKAVRALRHIGFCVKAAGDSYNDVSMLAAADGGILYNPPVNILREFPRFRVAKNYRDLLGQLSY